MYAVVKVGGHQERVAVGDEIEAHRVAAEPGEQVRLPAVLLVDEGSVTADAASLGSVAVSAEVVGHHRGPKIKILTYKNKTGSRRRKGHRQSLTRLRITDISRDGTPAAAGTGSTEA